MDDLETLDKKMLELLKEGKTPTEIAIIFNLEGHLTVKGESYKRKTINNRIAHLRTKGVDIPETNDIKRNVMKLIEPHIYTAGNGKFRVRKSVNGNMVCKTFEDLMSAQKFVREITGSETDKVLCKPTPKVSKVDMSSFFKEKEEEEDSDSSDIFTVMTFKGAGAKEMALHFLNNN